MWEGLESSASSAAKGIARMMTMAKQPAVPYLGIYIGMLVNLNELPTHTCVDGEELLDLGKFRKIGQVVRQIRKEQRHPYLFQVNKELQVEYTGVPMPCYVEVN
jgi:hypothetical protein